MAKRKQKNSSDPVPAVTHTPEWLVVLLAVSLIGNVVWVTRAYRQRSKENQATAVSSDSLQSGKSNGSRTSLAPDLAPYAALGSYLAENNHIPDLKWNDAQFEAFVRGVRASYEGQGYPMSDDAARLRDEISARVQAMVGTNSSDPVEEYFKTLREKEKVQRTPTGLHYRITQEGAGAKPGPEATVVVSYSARLPDGQALPTLTRTRVRSAVQDLLPGLGEGAQLLSPGGKALVYLPPALSFREGPWPSGVPRGAPIIFFLELHAIEP